MNKTLWVFGYGSLIWKPGFEVAEQALGRLKGWHRSFCMTSIHYRGTEENPGLVLALDAQENAVCAGVALRARAGEEEAVLAYLRERELVSSAYEERLLPVALADGRVVEALTYVINPANHQYCHHTLEEQAQIIARSCGKMGPNCDYLYNTAQHLGTLGIADPDLDWLAARVRHLTGCA